jgi:hypothetical protein
VVRYLARQGVVGIGVVHAGSAHLVKLLAVAGNRVGKVDDVENLGATKAGDLHGAHAAEARAWTQWVRRAEAHRRRLCAGPRIGRGCRSS